MRSPTFRHSLAAVLLVTWAATATTAINLGNLDPTATGYLNNSLSDCTACYGNIRKARCHRVVLGIYLRDLAGKNSGPGIPSGPAALSVITGSVDEITSTAGPQFNSANIFCLGFNELIAKRATTPAVLTAPPRELYYVRGAAAFLAAKLGPGTVVNSDVLRVAANGRLTSIGGRLKFTKAGTITTDEVRDELTKQIGGPAWQESRLSTTIGSVQFDQVSPSVVEVIIPFQDGAQF